MKKIFLFIVLQSIAYLGFAQAEHSGQHERNYVSPTEPAVKQNLDEWQNLKFGIMMHWGSYSQWGVVESWSICPEDWINRHGPFKDDWFTYKNEYEKLGKTFNPVDFNPSKWANAAKYAGMKYVVFTTKHHDGFAMFDTKLSDYKVTTSAFANNPKSNIVKEVFSAFRGEDFKVGAYFSKPDWHNQDYWWSYYPPKDRNPTYKPEMYPEKWEAFKQYTHDQIEELTTDYGSVDILWLDGGWVRPFSTIDSSVSWQKSIPFDQDINMAKIAKTARKNQPGLIIVDRTVGGPFENYITPEQEVPEHFIEVPWETCMTMAGGWSYNKNAKYKSTRRLIHTLAEVVSKNGNFLLNVAPSPEGDYSDTVYSRLKDIGDWMKINSEAIYNTKAKKELAKQGQFVFTTTSEAIYAIYLLGENETLKSTYTLENINYEIKDATLLGSNSSIKMKNKGNKVVLSNIPSQPTNPNAVVFKLNLK